jgi:hypothetical protein
MNTNEIYSKNKLIKVYSFDDDKEIEIEIEDERIYLDEVQVKEFN